ncbi:MAG: anaerobic glycerol-3-phosphate dehydrogenase subunit C [Muribaculaceae bacterium]|nr:anaerobic glycerol-3-phosphate dehydrogenase subunit C [Muribaculaceae bacterium]
MANKTHNFFISNNDGNFEQCLKCSICTVYCPVSAVDPLFPGPKQAGPDGERYRLKNPDFYDESLKLCLNCKRCEVACPHDVRIGDIIQRARLQHSPHKPGIRARLLASTDLVGRWATRLSPAINTAISLKSSKEFGHQMLGIHKHYDFPTYARQTFVKWFEKNALPQQGGFEKKVVYFHGCHVNYNDPAPGMALVRVMNKLGYGVELIDDEKCCGNPFMANGMPQRALQLAFRNMNSLRQIANKGLEVITTSSTCTFTIRDEYKFVLGLDNADIRDKVSLATRFIFKKLEDEELELPPVRPDFKIRIAYHTACHMEKLGWAFYSANLLRQIPGVELVMLDSLCCGMAGTYGFKTENFERSQKIGQPLFNAIKEANVDAVVTDCEMCHSQIAMSTGMKVLHPIEILDMAFS